MKLIGALIIIGVLVGPLAGFYYVSKDSFKALGYQGKEIAKVEKCISKRLSGSNARYVRAPKVTLKNGVSVIGTTDEIKFFWSCDKQIGTEVEVLYNLKNPAQAKINTFHEMWFMPLIVAIVCLIWYPVAIKGYLKKIKNLRN